MPLRIFEKRYQMMLSDVIKGERMIAIVAERDSHPDDELIEEPPFEVGTVGLIRVSKKQSDGTSLIMLQGISSSASSRLRRRLPIGSSIFILLRQLWMIKKLYPEKIFWKP